MSNKLGRRKQTAQRDKGFDFGTPLNYLRISDGEWVKQITQSQVVGCAYGRQYVPEFKEVIPCLSLIARDETLMRCAFQEFDRWTRGSDDDAVEMNIVFLNDGRYLLGISREPSRASSLTPVPALFDPIHVGQTWIKIMDSTNRYLLDLREYHRALIAPVVVGAVLMPQMLIAPQANTPMRPIVGTRPLVKFQLGFSQEGDDDISSSAQMILDMQRKQAGSANDTPERSSKDWAAKRSRVLREMFPLTMFRSRRNGLYNAVRTGLAASEVADWQIDQATCNLALSAFVGSREKHYKGISSKELIRKLAEATKDYAEIADGKDTLQGLSASDVSRQVGLDADYLVSQLGERPRDATLRARQSILRRRGYLET